MDCKNSVKFHYPLQTTGTHRQPSDEVVVDILPNPGDREPRSTAGSAAAPEAVLSGRRVERGAGTALPTVSNEQRIQMAENQNRFAELRITRLNARAAQIVRLERHARGLETRPVSVAACNALTTSAGSVLSGAAGMAGILSIGSWHPGVTVALLAGSVLGGGGVYALYRYLRNEEALAFADARADTPQIEGWLADLRARQVGGTVATVLEESLPRELAGIILEYAPPASLRQPDAPDAPDA